MLIVYPHIGILRFLIQGTNAGKDIFPAADFLKRVKEEYGEFAVLGTKSFGLDCMIDRDKLDLKTWWLTHGSA
jgi:hypothetical protein